MKTFHLKFNKESDGDWYIDFPGYPFAHHNLMMVAGANLLCQWAAEREGHLDCALVDVTTGDNLLDGKEPDIVMTRYRKGYGAYYHNASSSDGNPPVVVSEGRDTFIIVAAAVFILDNLILLGSLL